ncbi:hypothetical protein LBMAG20_16220 [Methylocystaceae bacterium]|nr:hypothetical protein LBMAG20_16220 [Methylocystaceae bacterium]
MITFIEKPILARELLRISEKHTTSEDERQFVASIIQEFSSDRTFNSICAEKTEALIDLINRHSD